MQSHQKNKLKLLRKLLQKPQTIKIIYPPGFGDVALLEITSILENLLAAKPFKGSICPLKKEIRIQHIYFFAIMELLLRSKCISDIRLIVYSDQVLGKKAFERACRSVDWTNYLTSSMSLKIKVNSVSSKLFHEGALKDILNSTLVPYVKTVFSEDEISETTKIYADLYKDKLTLSVSLAGESLYKRGYRGALSASAPLREDYAACSIQKAFNFALNINPSFCPEEIIIPFSGTGTFAFEYMLSAFHLPFAYFNRHYSIEKMPFFKKEYIQQILAKAKEFPNKLSKTIKITCIDNASGANEAFMNNVEQFNNQLLNHGYEKIPISILQKDFFSQILSPNGNTIIMMNPPYGIRFGKSLDSLKLYKKILKKTNEIIHHLKNQKAHLLGFILCPSEEAWSLFSNNIESNHIQTYHFTQGGLDIRVCQFYV